MTDLISRADAIKTVIRMCAPICDNTNDVVKALSALPSADAVSREEYVNALNDLAVAWKKKLADSVAVVRCKDCRHYQEVGDTHYGICYERPNVITSQKDEDYCSYGELAENAKLRENESFSDKGGDDSE